MVLVQVSARRNGSSSACSSSTTMLPTSLAMLLELYFLPKVGYPGITLPLCQAYYRDGYYSAMSLGCKGLSAAAAAHQAPPQNLAPSTLSQPLNPIQLCQQRSWHSSVAISLSWLATPLPGAGDALCLHIWASLQARCGPGSLQACRQVQAQRCSEFPMSRAHRCGRGLLRYPEAWLTTFLLHGGKL